MTGAKTRRLPQSLCLEVRVHENTISTFAWCSGSIVEEEIVFSSWELPGVCSCRSSRSGTTADCEIFDECYVE